MERLGKKEKFHKIYLGLLSYNFGETFLQQSWHFEPLPSDDIFMTKLQLSLDIASKHLIGLLAYNFGETFLQQSWHFVPFLSDDIFMTKL